MSIENILINLQFTRKKFIFMILFFVILCRVCIYTRHSYSVFSHIHANLTGMLRAHQASLVVFLLAPIKSTNSDCTIYERLLFL